MITGFLFGVFPFGVFLFGVFPFGVFPSEFPFAMIEIKIIQGQICSALGCQISWDYW
jgi:hypothetical protein